MAQTTSVLQAISQKELELRQRVEEAQRRAEALVRTARVEAGQTVAQADQEARREAEKLYQQGLEAARREAEALMTSAETQAAALRRRAMSRTDQAVRQIVNLVLPQNPAPVRPAAEEVSQPEQS